MAVLEGGGGAGSVMPDPARIMQVGLGFFASRTLLSAVELGLFGVLADGELDGEALRNRLGLHPRAAADFFDALVALGFLHRNGDGPAGRYANTAETETFLVPASPAYVGGIMVMAAHRLFPHWAHLTEALHSGQPFSESRETGISGTFESLYADPVRLEEFLAAMAGVQLGNFIFLAEQFDFSRFATICDVGGASSALCIAIARRHPGVRCISYDLPPVAPIARRKIEAAGFADRIEARPGDFRTEALPSADIIMMGNILHDWGTEMKQSLVAKAYAALPEGGAFIAIENIIDDARRQNAMGLLMSLNMLIETPEGYDYTFAQFDGWCRAAGFRRTETLPLTGPSSAAIAWK